MHRDVKPANFVILDAPDAFGARVKVVDFGLVKFDEDMKPDIQKLTAVGEVCGSPSYMSPEQSSSQKVDARSDIYSLGCSLFQALTGKLPFRGRNATETMLLHHEAPPPTLTSMGGGKTYPPDLELLVSKMIAKAPMDRYQSMDLVSQALGQIMESLGLVKPKAAPNKSRLDAHGTASSSPGKSEANSDPSAAFFDAQTTLPPGTTYGGSSSGRGQSMDTNAVRSETLKSETYEENPSDHLGTGLNKTTIAIVFFLVLSLAGSSIFLISKTFQPTKQTSSASSSNLSTGTSPGVRGHDSPNSAETEPGESSQFQSAYSLGEEGPIDVPNVKFFSTTISKNGSEYNEFHFAKPGKTVALASMGTNMEDGKLTLGTFTFPKGAPIYLTPFPIGKRAPQFFEKFRSGEIAGIFLSPMTASDELFNCAARVPGVSQLMMFHCSQLTEKILPALNKLKLELLVADGLKIDGEQLAKAHIWPNLVVLALSEGKHVTPVLKQLSGSRKLQLLSLSRNELSESDFQLVAKMPELKFLIMNEVKITKEDLRILAKLPKLETLSAVQDSWGNTSIIEELKQFPALKNLIISQGCIKNSDLRLLAHERPDLKVTLASGEHRMQGMFSILQKTGLKGLKVLPAFMTEQGGDRMRMMPGYKGHNGRGWMARPYGDRDDDGDRERHGSWRQWQGGRGDQGQIMQRFGHDDDDQ